MRRTCEGGNGSTCLGCFWQVLVSFGFGFVSLCQRVSNPAGGANVLEHETKTPTRLEDDPLAWDPVLGPWPT